jgi:hypothetical protein
MIFCFGNQKYKLLEGFAENGEGNILRILRLIEPNIFSHLVGIVTLW